MKKIGYLTLLAAAVLGLLWACSSNETEQGQTPRIDQIIPTSGDAGIEMKIEGFHFGDNPTAHIGFREMEVLSSSDNEIIAKVPQTAITGPITVTSNELRGVGEVFTVNDPPQEDIIGLDCASKSTLYSHKKYALTIGAITYPGDETITWSSDDEEVATVDNGVVTPVAPGEATITASFGTDTATCSITVVDGPVTSLTVTPTEVQLYRGETAQLTISDIMAEEGFDLADLEDATFTSSNEGVATVSDTGLITVEGVGETIVTAYLENKNVEVPVLVKEDIYVAGDYNNKVTYWKNGDEVVLPGEYGSASKVKVDGEGNVYLVGNDGDTAVLYINGNKVELNNGANLARAYDFIINQITDEIYIAGYEEIDFKAYPRVWKVKEGMVSGDHQVGDVEGEALTLIFNDDHSELLLGGNKNNGGYFWPHIWKIDIDGEIQDEFSFALPDGDGCVKSLIIGEQDVVTAFGSINDDDLGKLSKIWTLNSNLELIEDMEIGHNASGLSMIKDEQGNLFVLIRNNADEPIIWKNGTATNISSIVPAESQFSDFFVKNGNVYVCGFKEDDILVVWKIQENDEYEIIEVKQGIESNDNYINSIYVR